MGLDTDNPKWDIRKTRMKRRLTIADVQAALDGFVQAGLIRELATTPYQSPVDDNESELHALNRKRRKKRYGKREGALIKQIVEGFCPRFAPGATVVYIGDAENKFLHLEAAYLEGLGAVIAPSAKLPDVVVHDTERNWLLLVEAVASAGAVDLKRRNELKQLFKGCKAGLVFVTAFETRRALKSFLPLISWETEVWVAEAPDHLIHFDGERFLGPYPD